MTGKLAHVAISAVVSLTMLLFALPAHAADNAAWVSDNVPEEMFTGEIRSVSVTMQNTGTTTWTAAGGYKLGTQNPQDNTLWTGSTRVYLAAGESIAPGQTKTFTFNITAPSTNGSYNFQWRMVHEGIAWFGNSSWPRVIDVSQPAVTLCPGVQVFPDGATDLGPAFQQCINATPSGGTFEIPSGTYDILSPITITRPITMRTAGFGGSTASCETAGVSCAVLKAMPGTIGAFLVVRDTHNVTIDHLILDGNRGVRGGPAGECLNGNNRAGYNVGMWNCSYCRFTYNVSRYALCGTSLEFVGDHSTISNNVIRGNGENTPSLWSDGLTLLKFDYSTAANNILVDNTDVALILGGGRYAVVQNNSITQSFKVAFAGLMLDNFNSSQSGDFTGALVTGNTISCGASRNCHFGINIGPHPWFLSSNIFGGDVHGNTVNSARQGINVDGAGTASAPLVIYGNTISNSAPGSASFRNCTHATSPLNIYTTDSVVNRNGDTMPATSYQWHLCH